MKTNVVFRTNPADMSEEDVQYRSQPLAKVHEHFAPKLLGLERIRSRWCSGDIDRDSAVRLADRIRNFAISEIDPERRLQMKAYARAIKREPGCCGLFTYNNSRLVRKALKEKLADLPAHRPSVQAPADARGIRSVGEPVIVALAPLLNYPAVPSGTSAPEEGHQPVVVPGIPDRQSMKSSLDREELDSLISRLELLRSKIAGPHSTYRALVYNEKAARAYAAGRNVDKKIDEKSFRDSLQSTVDRIPAGFTCLTQEATFKNGFDKTSEGWLHIYDDGIGRASRRIYLNVSPDAAAEVFAFVVGHVMGNTKSPGKLGVKIQLPPGLYVRNHQLIVFCSERNEDDVKPVLAKYSRENPNFFMPETLPLTQGFGRGLSTGDNPADGKDSFTSLRAKAIYQALALANWGGLKGEAFRDFMKKQIPIELAGAGIDPRRPDVFTKPVRPTVLSQ